MAKKYELLKSDTITVNDATLYRIKSSRTFGYVGNGDLGGYVEKSENLSHDGDAWVFGDARVSGNARVYGGRWDKSPLQIQGTQDFVNIADKNIIQIGCESHTFDEWLNNFKTIGLENNYSAKEIAEYKQYIDLIINMYSNNKN